MHAHSLMLLAALLSLGAAEATPAPPPEEPEKDDGEPDQMPPNKRKSEE
jgi:hypothetical protein